MAFAPDQYISNPCQRLRSVLFEQLGEPRMAGIADALRFVQTSERKCQFVLRAGAANDAAAVATVVPPGEHGELGVAGLDLAAWRILVRYPFHVAGNLCTEVPALTKFLLGAIDVVLDRLLLPIERVE